MKIQETAIGILVDLIFSFVSFSILQSTITHIFYLGKSKNAVKKLRKEYSILERIRLRHVKDKMGNCARHTRALHVFLQLRNIYIAIFCLTILVHLLSMAHVFSAEIWDYYLKIKWCTVDAAAFLYSLAMTKHDKKHGGCTWRWE